MADFYLEDGGTTFLRSVSNFSQTTRRHILNNLRHVVRTGSGSNFSYLTRVLETGSKPKHAADQSRHLVSRSETHDARLRHVYVANIDTKFKHPKSFLSGDRDR